MSIHTAEAIALIHNRPGFAREVAKQFSFTHANEVQRVPVLGGFGLTKKQQDLLEFIRLFVHLNGVSPSYDEMKDAMDLASKSGVHRLIHSLEERGHIFRIPNRARSIVVRGNDA